MATEDMPPMVVSGNRYLDIEPYANRIRAADPIRWGSVFPWEFPQNAGRKQEEAFLRERFSTEEIHVQGGAGDKDTPGAGYKFLKQVWYCQAIWNWEQRVPALVDWWFKRSATLIEDPAMQKFILNPQAELSTFFQSNEIEMYGKKFLAQVIPMIQREAKVRMANGKPQTSEEETVDSRISRIETRVPSRLHASEPATASFDNMSDLLPLAKTVSQPVHVAPKMDSPLQTKQPTPKSAMPHLAHPRKLSEESQAPQEQPPLGRERGNGGRRFGNRGGQHRSDHDLRTAAHHGIQPTQVYQHPAAMPMDPYMGHMHFGPQHDFAPMAANPHLPTAPVPPQPRGGPQIHPFGSRHPSSAYAPVFDGNNPPYPIYLPTAAVDRVNGGGYHVSKEIADEAFFNYHASREPLRQDLRGGRGRGYSSDRGRGRGFRGGRNSFGSNGHASGPDLPRFTSYEFKAKHPGSKARRGSVISVEKNNWRSTSDHPQDFGNNQDENARPIRKSSKYVPAPDYVHPQLPMPGYLPGMASPVPPPSNSAWACDNTAQGKANSPYDPRFHCTQDAIGEWCTYANKVTVFDIPTDLHDEDLFRFFARFGIVENVHRLPRQSHHMETQMAFIKFKFPESARHCLKTKPDTWLSDDRPLRVEVPKEYWDSGHEKYWKHRVSAAAMGPPTALQTHDNFAMPPYMAIHQTHGSSSTIRGPAIAAEERQAESGETTPTASGANTPKKKSKIKKKPKRDNDMRKASVAEGSEQAADADPEGKKDAAIVVAKDSTATATDSMLSSTPADITLDIEKQHTALETNEGEETSEPSLTPVTNQATSKLRTSKKSKDANDNGELSGPGSAIQAADVQCADEPPNTPTASGNVTLPPNNGHADRLFRDEAKKETPSTTVGDAGALEQGKDATASTAADVATPGKSEEEHIDDSFHTATGSPDSTKDADKIAGKRAVAPATPVDEAAQGTSTAELADKGFVLKAHGTQTAETLGEMKSADASVQSDLPKIDTQGLSKTQKRKLANRSASGGSALAPPTEFVTAPNTPLVDQDPEKPNLATEVAQPALPKKTEKKKGPATTASFSEFAKDKQQKKQVKKPKQGKKGTLKGKPKEMQESSDRVAAPAIQGAKTSTDVDAVPSNEHESDLGGGVKPTESSKSKAGDESDASNSKPSPNTGLGTPGLLSTTDSGQLPSSTEQESSKAKVILNNITALFRGQTSQSNPKDKQTMASGSETSSLTDVKAPKTDPEQSEQVKKTLEFEKPASTAEHAARPSKPQSHGPTLDVLSSDAMHINESGADVEVGGTVDAAQNAGLGIEGACAGDNDSELNPKKKKRPKSKKKKNKQSQDDTTPKTTPEPELEHKGPSSPPTSSFTFHHPSPSSFRSTHSDTSSNTMGDATPSAGTSSPVVAKQVRSKFLSNTLTVDNSVVREKEPRWIKNKKRPLRSISSGPEESEEEGTNYALQSAESNEEGNDNGEPLSINVVDTAAGMQTPRTIIWMVPPGKTIILLSTRSNDEQAGENESEEATSPKTATLTTSASRPKQLGHDSVDGEGWVGHSTDNTTVNVAKARMKMLDEQESHRKMKARKRGGGGDGTGEQVQMPKREVDVEMVDGSARIEELGKLFPRRIIVRITRVDSSEDD